MAVSFGTLSKDCSTSFGKVFPNWLETVWKLWPVFYVTKSIIDGSQKNKFWKKQFPVEASRRQILVNALDMFWLQIVIIRGSSSFGGCVFYGSISMWIQKSSSMDCKVYICEKAISCWGVWCIRRQTTLWIYFDYKLSSSVVWGLVIIINCQGRGYIPSCKNCGVKLLGFCLLFDVFLHYSHSSSNAVTLWHWTEYDY